MKPKVYYDLKYIRNRINMTFLRSGKIFERVKITLHILLIFHPEKCHPMKSQ